MTTLREQMIDVCVKQAVKELYQAGRPRFILVNMAESNHVTQFEAGKIRSIWWGLFGCGRDPI